MVTRVEVNLGSLPVAGEAGNLARFLPYDSGSAMFALEILGWGLFLGLAALAAAPLFGGGRLGLGIRWSFAAYGVLGLTSAVGHAIGNDTMTLVGFAAWGFVLYVATGLIAVHFRRLSAHAPVRQLLGTAPSATRSF